MAHVLVVEDSRDSREPLAKLLRRDGFDVACAADGLEALDLIAQRRPDVVLLDLMMPRMDGISFLKILRGTEGLEHLPVIVVTAAGESPLVNETKKYNVHATLIKSRFSYGDLRRAIQDVLPPSGSPASKPVAWM